MKNNYLDIMEKALSAYTVDRIREYIDETKRDGVTEHGFPRLGANIGILMAHGRRHDLKDEFVEIINLCCNMFTSPIADNEWHYGVNFSIREVCCALMELEKTDVIEKELLENWKAQLSSINPWSVYSHIVSEKLPKPANWAYFGAVSEQARGLLCGIDTVEFVENQLPSQLSRLDENGMYRDGDFRGPHQPLLYDMMTRVLLGLSLYFGYNGKYAFEIEKMMDVSDDLTLKMQSVTGELPFGGRSNQFLFNETVIASYYELRATILNKKGETQKAAIFKAAAKKATETALFLLNREPMSHVKNRFDPDLMLGCEHYAYFNKYMITVASNAYLAYLVADDSIKAGVATTDVGGYVAQTGEDFHKVFINKGGYFLEIECNADTHYDANGLGRVHKQGCDSCVCLSVPMPQKEPHYNLEFPNPHPLSMCGFKATENGLINSAQNGVNHVLVSKAEQEQQITAVFDCDLNGEALFSIKYTVSDQGVDIKFDGADGILLPVFLFDGKNETEMTETKGQFVVKYNGSFCKYTFSGKVKKYGKFFNRNGRYCAYKLNTDQLHIEIGDINEL